MVNLRIKTILISACVLLSVTVQAAWAGPAGFTLHNTTGVIIHAVYVGPSESDDWGENLLEPEETIDDGSDIDVEFAPDESVELWDMRVEDGGGNALNFHEINLLDAETVILKEDNTAVIK